MRCRRAPRALARAAALALAVTIAPLPLVGQSPPTGGPAAALLDAADRRARAGDTGGALSDYQQLLELYPESPQAPEAMLRIARGWRSAGDHDAALAAVERLLTDFRGSPQAASGLLLEGRILSESAAGKADLETARASLEKVWMLFPRDDFPTLTARSAARVLDGQIALRLERFAEAAASFVAVMEMERASPATAAAHVGFGMALVRMGDWQAAAESFQDALGGGAGDEVAALARRRLALLERRFLRPAAGARLWERARQVAVPGAEKIAGVAADDRGRLLIVDSGANRALVLGTDGTVETGLPARKAERPSWSPSSTGVVAADEAVLLLGEQSRQFPAPGRERTLDGLRAAERGAFGEWFVVASRYGVVSYPAQPGAGRTLLGDDGDPVDLASDGAGRIYVLERKGQRVVRIEPGDGASQKVVDGPWRKASALAVDPFGFVHVLDAGDRRIHSYDPSGAEVDAVGPTLPGGVDLRSAEDLAATGDGRLLVAAGKAGLIVLE